MTEASGLESLDDLLFLGYGCLLVLLSSILCRAEDDGEEEAAAVRAAPAARRGTRGAARVAGTLVLLPL